MFFFGVLSDFFFFLIRLRLWVLGKTTQYSQHIKSICFSDDVMLVDLAEISFFIIKLFLPPFSYYTFWKEIAKCSPHLGPRGENS